MAEVDKIERLRSVVDDSGLSVLQFAIKAGVNQSNLSQILRRRRNLGSNVLMSIANAYNVNYHWLTSGEGDKYKKEDEPKDILAESQATYSQVADYREKYINELEDQVRLLKELTQNLQKELNEKSEIIQGFMSGSIEVISKK